MDGSDLIVNGEIVLEGTILNHEWCQWEASGCFSARMVREALALFSGDVTVRVNSGGGDPFEGESIRVALASHSGAVRVVVAGVAASAASLMIMGAGRIEISAGSFIMIHDPSGDVFGTADDHEQEASRLRTLSATYAGVYAARTGQPVDAIVQMMGDETWLGGEEAVTAGFADALLQADTAEVSAAPESSAAALTMRRAEARYASAMEMVRRAHQHFSADGMPPRAITTARAGHSQAATAATMEVSTMDPDELTAAAQTPNDAAPQVSGGNPPGTQDPGNTAPTAATTMAVTGQTAASAPAADAAELRGAQYERERQRQIRTMAAPFMQAGQLTQAQIDALIDEGTPAEHAGNRLMAVMAASETPVAPVAASAARVTRDETDTRVEGMIQAMMRNYEGPGEQFRGMRLRGLAMELSGQRGFNDMQRMQAGFRSTTMMGGAHGVSDFAYITTEVMNRTLIDEYQRRGANWNIVTGAPLSASDFREMHAVRFGGDFQLKTVKENGEYHEATLSDQAEGLKVERRGRTIHLTFEAVVNDDMGAFDRIPREFATQGRIMESSMVWGLIRKNAVLKSDTMALFHADHSNLAGSGGAISVATVGAGRKAMMQQKAFGSKAGDDFLGYSPDLLVVPPALETAAGQFVTSITPAKVTDVNPYRQSLTPHTVPQLGAAVQGGSDSAWYLFCSDLPPIDVAYLEGYESPTVRTIEGLNPDRVSMSARHIFGAAAVEFRGSYKNGG